MGHPNSCCNWPVTAYAPLTSVDTQGILHQEATVCRFRQMVERAMDTVSQDRMRQCRTHLRPGHDGCKTFSTGAVLAKWPRP